MARSPGRMDSTRVTEHPNSHEGHQPGAAGPTAPADPRGGMLRTPEPSAQGTGSTALPAQSGPQCSPTPAEARRAATGTPAGSHGTPVPSDGHGPAGTPPRLLTDGQHRNPTGF